MPRELAATPEGRSALDVIAGEQRRHLEAVLATVTDPEGISGHSDYLLQLDRPDLEELMRELDAVVGRYKGRGGRHHVGLHLVSGPSDLP